MSSSEDIRRTLTLEESQPEETPELDEPQGYSRKLTGPGVKYAFKRAVKKFSLDQGTDLSAMLTYFTVLAIAPALLAIFSILSLVLAANADSVRTMIDDAIVQAVPADYQDLATNLVETMMSSATGGVIALIIGTATALWSASAYVKAFSRNLNRIYGVVEGRGFVKFNGTMVLVTATMLVGVVLILVALAVNRPLVEGVLGPIAQPLGWDAGLAFLTDSFLPWWAWLRYPVVVLLVVVIIGVLYHFTPNIQKPQVQWLSLGAVVAIVGIAVAGVALVIYLTYFAGYSSYGLIGTLMALLFVLWVFNIVILLGAEVDVELERARQLQAGIRAEETIQLPPRDVAKVEKMKKAQDGLVEDGRVLRRAMYDPDR